MVAGDSSEDEDVWRVAERYCIYHRAAYDMHEMVENIIMRAIEFMHHSCLCMDEDHVGTSSVSQRISTSGAWSVVPRI